MFSATPYTLILLPSIYLLTLCPKITVAIGSEIRQSSALADDLNNSFDNTRVRLRGTMNRMLRMAARTGVGWRVWLLFFVVVFFLFAYVWLSQTGRNHLVLFLDHWVSEHDFVRLDIFHFFSLLDQFFLWDSQHAFGVFGRLGYMLRLFSGELGPLAHSLCVISSGRG